MVCFRLRILCLGGNYLNEVPSTVGSLANLEGLILSDNALETLPSTIANLKNLKSLLLHKNRLRMLPTEIIALKCLTEVSFPTLVSWCCRVESFEEFENCCLVLEVRNFIYEYELQTRQFIALFRRHCQF